MTDTSYPKLRWTRNRDSGRYESVAGYAIDCIGAGAVWKLRRNGETLATTSTLTEAKAYADRLEGR